MLNDLAGSRVLVSNLNPMGLMAVMVAAKIGRLAQKALDVV
jgi:hypothetical protein